MRIRRARRVSQLSRVIAVTVINYLEGEAVNTFINRVIGKCFLLFRQNRLKLFRVHRTGVSFFEITQLVKRLSHGK